MKTVRKLTPVHQYDVAGLESWLEDMAAKGLFLKRFRPLFCTFTKDTPRRTRYRVEPCQRKVGGEAPQSMLDLYLDFGWDYVDKASDDLLIFSTRDLHAPELHSDPALLGELWQKLYRDKRKEILRDLLRLLLLGAGLILIWGYFGLVFLMTAGSYLFLMEALRLFDLFTHLVELRKISRIAGPLEEGLPLSHRASYPRRRLRTLISFLLSVALLVALLVNAWAPSFSGKNRYGYPIGDLPFSPITFSELDGRNAASVGVARHKRSPLCLSNWYLLDNTGSEAGMIWLEVDYYRPTLPGLAPALAQDLLEQIQRTKDGKLWWTVDQGDYGPWTVTEYPVDGADFLAVARLEGSPFQGAAVAANGRAAAIRYTGPADLADHLEEIAAMVKG